MTDLNHLYNKPLQVSLLNELRAFQGYVFEGASEIPYGLDKEFATIFVFNEGIYTPQHLVQNLRAGLELPSNFNLSFREREPHEVLFQSHFSRTYQEVENRIGREPLDQLLIQKDNIRSIRESIDHSGILKK